MTPRPTVTSHPAVRARRPAPRCSTVRQVASRAVPIHRLTPDDVLAMVRAGILDEDDRVELVDGVLVEMNPTGPDHEDAQTALNEYFVAVARLKVKAEGMFLTTDGYLVPDLQVAPDFPRGVLSRFAPLVVEIAQSSHRRDREKIASYARAGVPEYWIVDVVDELVVVHRDPIQSVYETVTEHRDGTLQPLLDVPPLTLDTLFARE